MLISGWDRLDTIKQAENSLAQFSGVTKKKKKKRTFHNIKITFKTKRQYVFHSHEIVKE